MKGNLNSNLTIELLLYFLSCCGKIRQNRRDKLYPERLFSSIEYFEIEKSATVEQFPTQSPGQEENDINVFNRGLRANIS